MMKNNKKLGITLCVVIWPFLLKAISLTPEQKRQILTCTNSYTSALELYSDNKNALQRSHLNSLVKNPFKSKHVNDLNLFINDDEINNNDDPNVIVADYLKIIDESPAKFSFDFEKPNPIDCIDGDVAVVCINKKITYNGITKTFAEIILVTLPQVEEDGNGYRISEVLSAENYKGENNACGAIIEVPDDKIELYQKKKDADNYFFEKKDFLTAKNLYDYILSKEPADQYSKKQVALCNQRLTRNDYNDKAVFFGERSDFESAIYWYQRLLNEYPNDDEVNVIKDKITALKLEITERTFKNNINKANQAFLQSNFNDARFYYEQALQIKNNDRYAFSQLERAKVQDDQYAAEEINRVIALAQQSDKYWGEYFRVLIKYEGYGNHVRLNAKQYLNMVLLLNSYEKHVMTTMNFSRRECRLYCRIYCKKLNDLYYSERDPNLKEEIRHLLDNVINERNQN